MSANPTCSSFPFRQSFHIQDRPSENSVNHLQCLVQFIIEVRWKVFCFACHPFRENTKHEYNQVVHSVQIKDKDHFLFQQIHSCLGVLSLEPCTAIVTHAYSKPLNKSQHSISSPNCLLHLCFTQEHHQILCATAVSVIKETDCSLSPFK